jgi:urease accessory protein
MATDTRGNVALVRLLQLASPALPVGAYSYSQGLESAIESGFVNDEASTLAWTQDVLRLSLATMEAPVFVRMCEAWRSNDLAEAQRWNDLFLASRESAELRAETAQMGFSLAQLLRQLGEAHPFASWQEVSFPAAFTFCAVRWEVEPRAALIGYLWSWAENQIVAAIKAVPLGQGAGQRLLSVLGPRLVDCAEGASDVPDDRLSNMAPGLALLSAQHETQYSRLFRS